MKKRTILMTTLAVISCGILPSCGLISSAARLPGSLLQMVGRTAGLPIKQKQESTLKPSFEVVEGEIDQLD